MYCEILLLLVKRWRTRSDNIGALTFPEKWWKLFEHGMEKKNIYNVYKNASELSRTSGCVFWLRSNHFFSFRQRLSTACAPVFILYTIQYKRFYCVRCFFLLFFSVSHPFLSHASLLFPQSLFFPRRRFFPYRGLGQIKGRMIIFNPWLH